MPWILKRYADVSGLQLNKAKTEIFKNNNIPGLTKLGLKLSQGSIRYLGIWFNKEECEMEYKNFRIGLRELKTC